ncbi:MULTISPECIES: FMN-dependent NADH-azoreductase [unclassified Nocardiopsis]|uniref:FMN-dependent NADH-azoreductase n=1 Tax=unclassified Nocardiopsis TaxID=2649073 RepID=UPI00135C3AC2|nr:MULTISPECIES: NAD(P)H-dependent oxidoreductase [unclassified Nocardiopsis]
MIDGPRRERPERGAEPVTSLLHLDSSHSRDSVSRHLTGLFAREWRRLHPDGGYRYRNLATEPVPMITSKYCSFAQRVERYGALPPAAVASLAEDPSEEWEWELTFPLADEVLHASTVLIGVPMYNFTVPASLKAWIDRITFPGVFKDPDSGSSLLQGTKVVVVTARGGAYGPGTPKEAYDFQTPYLRSYFEGLGIADRDLHFVHAEMTRAADVPELARFQDLAARSLTEAETALTALPLRLAGYETVSH